MGGEGGPIRSHKDLRVWQEAMQLAEDCYRLTASYPREEMFGLVRQIRRAAVSIPANIAEGYGRDGKGEYVQFLRIAHGSVNELETHLLLSERLAFGDSLAMSAAIHKTDTVSRMLRGLYRSVRSK
jgi:four helix bundle protein